MTLPLWTALLLLIGTLASPVVAGWFLVKNNNRTAGVTETGNLIHGQQEIIAALKGNTTDYQAILEKWAQAVKNEAEMAATLRSMTSELKELKEKFDRLQHSFDELKEQYVGAKERASRVPELEQEIAALRQRLDRKEVVIEHKDDLLDTANIMATAAAAGQNRVEGALAEAERVINPVPKSTCEPKGEPPTRDDDY